VSASVSSSVDSSCPTAAFARAVALLHMYRRNNLNLGWEGHASCCKTPLEHTSSIKLLREAGEGRRLGNVPRSGCALLCLSTQCTTPSACGFVASLSTHQSLGAILLTLPDFHQFHAGTSGNHSAQEHVDLLEAGKICWQMHQAGTYSRMCAWNLEAIQVPFANRNSLFLKA
jgi:hypothetical protein